MKGEFLMKNTTRTSTRKVKELLIYTSSQDLIKVDKNISCEESITQVTHNNIPISTERIYRLSSIDKAWYDPSYQYEFWITFSNGSQIQLNDIVNTNQENLLILSKTSPSR